MVPSDADAPQSRPPTLEDLLRLCRGLNAEGARYLVIGGFAVNHHGLVRATMDIELLVDQSEQNQQRISKALEVLPDKAVRELRPGDLERYVVVRIADEIVVDLMAAACGVTYAEAAADAQLVTIEDVKIPFASARSLLRMKQTSRAKDEMDRLFLERLLAGHGEQES